MSLDSWQCRWEGLDSVDRMQEQSWGWEGLTGMMVPYRTQSMEWSWLSLSVVSPRNFLIYGSVGYIYLWHTARDVSASWQTSSETNDVKPSEAKNQSITGISISVCIIRLLKSQGGMTSVGCLSSTVSPQKLTLDDYDSSMSVQECSVPLLVMAGMGLEVQCGRLHGVVVLFVFLAPLSPSHIHL